MAPLEFLSPLRGGMQILSTSHDEMSPNLASSSTIHLPTEPATTLPPPTTALRQRLTRQWWKSEGKKESGCKDSERMTRWATRRFILLFLTSLRFQGSDHQTTANSCFRPINITNSSIASVSRCPITSSQPGGGTEVCPPCNVTFFLDISRWETLFCRVADSNAALSYLIIFSL